MSSHSNHHIWHPEQYHHHSSVQASAAMELLCQLCLKNCEKILDIGCGDGKITARIAHAVPNGSVMGIDASKEMISFARREFSASLYKNLTFAVHNAQLFDYKEQFDVLFSSFALQWIEDIDMFLQCAYASLKPGGHIAATIPLGISPELDKAIEDVIKGTAWIDYFRTFSPKWHFLADTEYKRLILKNHFRLEMFKIASQEIIFDSRQHFENYVISWFSYLHVLPPDLQPLFFAKVIDNYLTYNTLLENKGVSFKFARVDLIAQKT